MIDLAKGVSVNILFIGVFLAAAAILTAISPHSTFVLTYAPLVQAILIALPVVWIYKAIRGQRPLAAGLGVGVMLQLACFCLWVRFWLHTHAG